MMKYLLPIVLCLTTLLTGCVDYQVGVNFDSPYSGEIVQQVKVSDKLSNLAPGETKRWLSSLESRSRKLDGRVEKLDDRDLLLTIPFGNSVELAEKFNRLFQTNIVPNATIPKEQMELVELNSQASLKQNNLIFFERNHLDLAIDLRALTVLSQQDKIKIDLADLAELKFQLTSPGIVRSVAGKDNLQPVENALKRGLVWQLYPGEVNHIEAVFWLPSPLGIGALAIAMLMILGYVAKYRRFPGVT